MPKPGSIRPHSSKPGRSELVFSLGSVGSSRVVVRVVIRRKNGSSLDDRARAAYCFKLIRQKAAECTASLVIRDREAAGSNPGPPTKIEFKFGALVSSV